MLSLLGPKACKTFGELQDGRRRSTATGMTRVGGRREAQIVSSILAIEQACYAGTITPTQVRLD